MACNMTPWSRARGRDVKIAPKLRCTPPTPPSHSTAPAAGTHHRYVGWTQRLPLSTAAWGLCDAYDAAALLPSPPFFPPLWWNGGSHPPSQAIHRRPHSCEHTTAAMHPATAPFHQNAAGTHLLYSRVSCPLAPSADTRPQSSNEQQPQYSAPPNITHPSVWRGAPKRRSLSTTILRAPSLFFMAPSIHQQRPCRHYGGSPCVRVSEPAKKPLLS